MSPSPDSDDTMKLEQALRGLYRRQPDADFVAALERRLPSVRAADPGSVVGDSPRRDGAQEALRRRAPRTRRRTPVMLRPSAWSKSVTVAATVTVVAAVSLAAFAAGSSGATLDRDAAQSFLGRVRGFLIPPQAAPTLEPEVGDQKPQYILPGGRILALDNGDLVSATGPFAARSDVISATVKWLYTDGTRTGEKKTRLAFIGDYSGLIRDATDDLPPETDSVMLTRSMFFRSASGLVLEGRDSTMSGPPENLLRSASSRSEHVELPRLPLGSAVDLVVSAKVHPLEDPDAVLAQGELAVPLELLSPHRGELQPAVPVDVRQSKHGVTVDVTALGVDSAATSLLVAAASDDPGDLVTLGVGREWADEPVAELAYLRDEFGRTYELRDFVGRPGAEGYQNWRPPATLVFDPLPDDVRPVTLVIPTLEIVRDEYVGGRLTRDGYPLDELWAKYGKADVATLQVPLGGSKPLGAEDAHELDRKNALANHNSAVLLNKEVTVHGHPFRVRSVVPYGLWRSGAFNVYVDLGNEINGRTLLNLEMNVVGRDDDLVRRILGVVVDEGPELCGVSGSSGRGPQLVRNGVQQTDLLLTHVGSLDRWLSSGEVTLCFKKPRFLLTGPWELPVPLASAEGDRGD